MVLRLLYQRHDSTRRGRIVTANVRVQPPPKAVGCDALLCGILLCTPWPSACLLTAMSRPSPLHLKSLPSGLSQAAATYSITRSARSRTDCGISNPIALAVFMFTTISNFVGCSIGKSPGLAPFRILSTYVAARR